MKPKFLIASFLACVMAGLLSYQAIQNSKGPEKDIKAQYLEGGDFKLQGFQGDTTLAQFSGAPMVLYFGFTFCPDVCPVGLTVIRDAINSDPALADIQSLFITLDPERDTIERLKEYLAFFHPNLHGATGPLAEIQAVAKRYGTYFAKTKADETGNYSVDHTAYFYVLDANGELVRVMDHNTKAQALASAIKNLL